MITNIPAVNIAPSADWEIILFPPALLAVGLRMVSITDRGIYIEDLVGRYDLIPFAELALLLETAPKPPSLLSSPATPVSSPPQPTGRSSHALTRIHNAH